MREMDKRPKIIVLTGPTGVGKTEMSLVLAETYRGEIINSDSMQFYREMDVGTAKPTPDETARAPHHLFDVADPDEDFDAAAYLKLARPLIEELHRKKTPILVVGGTGLYLRSLIHGLFEGPGQDPEIRRRISAEAEKEGRAAMHEKLAAVDPAAAERLHPNDLVRIIRALEVYSLTGKPISSFQERHALGEEPYQVLFYCLNLNREELYARIEKRTEIMMKTGLVEEVRTLLDKGYSPELKTMQAIGYKQVVAYIMGKSSLEETTAEIKKQTRRFAKRQLTWFRSQKNVIWRSPRDIDEVVSEVGAFL